MPSSFYNESRTAPLAAPPLAGCAANQSATVRARIWPAVTAFSPTTYNTRKIRRLFLSRRGLGLHWTASVGVEDAARSPTRSRCDAQPCPISRHDASGGESFHFGGVENARPAARPCPRTAPRWTGRYLAISPAPCFISTFHAVLSSVYTPSGLRRSKFSRSFHPAVDQHDRS